MLAAGRLADRRLRRRADIASALGAPVLGTVAGPPDQGLAENRRAPVRWLLGAAASAPSLPPNEYRLELLRYGRVLERLYGVSGGPLRIVVVTPDDDDAAAHAVDLLAAAAEADGRTVAVLSDVRALPAAAEDRGDEETMFPSASVVLADGADDAYPYGVALRAVSVPPARPTVPRDATASGALIVTTSGKRTSWELLALAEACRDAMLPVLGALVVVPVGEEEDVEAGSPVAASEPTIPPMVQLNGHRNGVKP